LLNKIHLTICVNEYKIESMQDKLEQKVVKNMGDKNPKKAPKKKGSASAAAGTTKKK
jgi:hypothetical protein